MTITITAPDGSRRPISDTRLAALADVIRTVAAEGEEALFRWFLPEHRPPVEDVELGPDGTVILFLFAV